MNWNTVALADVTPSAWKNGGGITRELLAWPHPTDWVFRLSVAEVQTDGPFSRFDGVQRWFAVLSGAGVGLRVGAGVSLRMGAGVGLRMGAMAPSEVHVLTPASSPLCFDGALPVDCTLIDGATHDFNLMVRTDQAQARMQQVAGRLQSEGTGPRTVAVWAGDAGAALWLGQECASVSAHTLAWQELPAGAAVEVIAAHALLMEIHPCP